MADDPKITDKSDAKPAASPQKAPARPKSTGGSNPSASATREASQNETDRVAIVSRTATGEAHQHPGYEVLVDDDADEATKAAAENRPEKS